MKSLRAAVKKAGLDRPILSVQEIAKVVKVLPQPVSMLRLLNQLDPEHLTFATGDVQALDLSGSAFFVVLSSGYVVLKGSLKNTGFLTSDNYVFAAFISPLDASGKAHGIKQSGHLDPSYGTGVQRTGYDEWVEKNWTAIKKSDSFHYSLKADRSQSIHKLENELIATLAVGFAVAVLAAFWVGAAEGAPVYVRPTPDGQGVDVFVKYQY